ncbi:MAG: hypothetical protein K2X93_22145 [Candidatus Obscuribacterales bacterium]|nr:hypothetical protein [Candidatus Obscuribacterales bacterium]
MHPKASAETVEELRASEARMLEEQAKFAKMQADNQASMNGMGRVLPPVSTDPIAPPAETIAQNGPVVNSYDPMQTNSSSAAQAAETSKIDGTTITPAKDAGTPVESPPEAASYSSHYSGSVPPPPPGAVAGGLVPPPPAVTLSTNAAVAYGGGQDQPWANPQLNPWGIQYQQYPPQYPPQGYPPQGYPPQYQPPPQAVPPPQEPQRPQGLFGSGKRHHSEEDGSEDDEDASAKPEKKEVDFVPIRPTGMESRSPYKQKEDLKILWTGAQNTYSMQKLMEREKDLQGILRRVDVGLPPDATKGMFTVAPRRVASIFRPIASDRRSIEHVRKVQFELVQGYYRYLYAYNKYAIQQQTVQARKQEIEVASSKAEKQRAEADMARATDAAQSATEDMRAAQEELAAVAGAQAARSIIGKISGITPSAQTLAQAEKSAEPIEVDSKPGGMFGSMFSFGGKKSSPPVKEAVAESPAPIKVNDKPSKDKSPKPKKDKKGKSADEGEDLAPSRPVAFRGSKSEVPPESPRTQSGPISFELKDIEITARKSILTVAIHNTGSETFKFSPEVISIAEGDKKISEAAMRAEFDSTSVRPNGEVQGKITLFGRPWNDRLSVYISDGSNNIQLKRNHN